LTELDVRDNKITIPGYRQLIDMLHYNETITTLYSDSKEVDKMNTFSIRGSKSVESAESSMKNLSLSSCKYHYFLTHHQDPAKHIAAAMKLTLESELKKKRFEARACISR
jgi:hypothetical protein